MNQIRECTHYRYRGRYWDGKPVRDRRQVPLDMPFRSAGVAFKMSRVSLRPRSNSTLLPILSPHARPQTRGREAIHQRRLRSSLCSTLTTFGHSASRVSSASAAALGNSIDCAMSRKPSGKCFWWARLSAVSPKNLLNFRLGCYLDAELGSFLN